MRAWLVATALLVWSVPVAAQDLNEFDRTLEKLLETRYETTAGLAAIERTRIRYGAYTTFALLGVDDEGGRTHVLRQTDAKLWAQAQTGGHMLYGRVRLRYRDYNKGDSFDGSGDDLVDPVGDRYWYRFEWRAHRRARHAEDPDLNWWLQVGRQFIHWASGIVFSDTLFAVRFGAENRWARVEGFAGFSPDEMVDFDASRPGFASDTDRDFFGIMITLTAVTHHQPYLYVVNQQDDNNTVIGVSRFGYDSTYIAAGSVGQITGSLLYRAEIVYETGRSVSDILGAVFPQTIDDVRAWAGRIEIVWSPHRYRHTARVRFEFEFMIGTGDADRLSSNQAVGGNTGLTDDNSFNAFGVNRTGLALAPELSNLLSLRLSASAFPLHGRGVLDKLRFQIDLFVFGELDSDAPLSVTTTPGEKFVGAEIDLVIEWQPLSDVSLDFRYGIFLPGDAIADSDPRHFFYLGVSYGF